MTLERLRWRKWKGGWAVIGPAALVRGGEVVEVWSEKSQCFSDVLLRRFTISDATDADLRIGFPQSGNFR